MRQTLIFSVVFSLGLGVSATPVASAQPDDDWTVTRDPFDRQVIARYKAILDRDPGDTAALRKLVTLYKRYRTVALLVSEYEAGFAADPKRFSHALVLGHLALEQGNADQALSYYEKAALLRPDSPLVQLGLGELYSRAGQNDKARTAFEVALANTKSKPIKKDVLRKLASLALGASDIAGAKSFYEQYLAIDPKDVDIRIEFPGSLCPGEDNAEAQRRRGAEAQRAWYHCDRRGVFAFYAFPLISPPPTRGGGPGWVLSPEHLVQIPRR